jgi:hypothetical protein
MNIEEQWRSVTGHPFYEVSDAGQVRCLAHERMVSNGCGRFTKRRYAARMLRQYPITNGYLQVGLNQGRRALVHRLVAFAFLTRPSLQHELNHLNGIKTDNRVVNLEWVTRRENLLHSSRVLGNPADCFVSKLSNEQRQVIRARLAQGEYATDMCAEYGVSATTIYRCGLDAGDVT